MIDTCIFHIKIGQQFDTDSKQNLILQGDSPDSSQVDSNLRSRCSGRI